MQPAIIVNWHQIDIYETLRFLSIVLIYLLAFKAFIGFHWKWEKCNCPDCGKKFKDHKKDDK